MFQNLGFETWGLSRWIRARVEVMKRRGKFGKLFFMGDLSLKIDILFFSNFFCVNYVRITCIRAAATIRKNISKNN